MLSTIQTNYTNGCYKVGEMRENTLWWPKNVHKYCFMKWYHFELPQSQN